MWTWQNLQFQCPLVLQSQPRIRRSYFELLLYSQRIATAVLMFSLMQFQRDLYLLPEFADQANVKTAAWWEP